MQQLLRGRLLYLLLLLLVVFLYARGVPTTQRELQGRPATAIGDQRMVWWPEHLDANSFRETVQRDPQLAFILSGLGVFILLMGTGGVVMTGWGLVTGRARSLWHFPPRSLPGWTVGEMARIAALTVLVGSLLPFARVIMLPFHPDQAADVHRWLTTAMLFLDLFVIVTIIAFASGKGRSVWQAVGLSRHRLARSLTASLRGYMLVFPWIFVLLLLVAELVRQLGVTPPMEPIQELVFQEQRSSVLLTTVVLACLVAPVAEELFFRGVVYAALRQRSSRLVATLLSGAVFSLIHTNLVGFLPIMALGCLLAYLYERTGSLAGPIAVHILHNSLLMSVALVFRHFMSLV